MCQIIVSWSSAIILLHIKLIFITNPVVFTYHVAFYYKSGWSREKIEKKKRGGGGRWTRFIVIKAC